MMNMYEHKILQGFQGTHVTERTRTLQDHSLKIAWGLNLFSTLFHRG